ncbi:Spt4/RpoE2 zinc finger, partial [Trinorchestia longiramus]
KAKKEYRACIICSRLEDFNDIRKYGCDNCLKLFKLYTRSFFKDCTSSNFRGYIMLYSPAKSWVAKWQRLSEKYPGEYCLTVEGKLYNRYLKFMEDNGMDYVERDKS